MAAGLARADLILAIGSDSAQTSFQTRWSALPKPLLQGELRPLKMGMDWQGEKVIAFAGIGNPSKFFTTLRGEGAHILRAVALDDHQPLSDALMQRLELEATARGAQLVTTEKDAVRLPHAFRMKVLTLVVRLHLADWTALDAALSDLSL